MNLSYITTLVLASAFLAGCGGTNPDAAGSSAVRSSPGSSSSEAYDGPRIPLGTYQKKLRRSQFVALGVDLHDPHVGDRFAADGTTYVVWRLTEHAFTQFEGKSPTQVEVGSSGAYRYDKRGRLVLTEACCGDTVARWHINGRSLTLVPLPPSEAFSDPLGRLMVGGTYNRTSTS